MGLSADLANPKPSLKPLFASTKHVPEAGRAPASVHPRPLRRGRAETSHLCSKQKGAEKEHCRGGPSSLKLAQGGPLAAACHKCVMAGRARVRGSARADTHTPMTVFVPVYQLS